MLCNIKEGVWMNTPQALVLWYFYYDWLQFSSCLLCLFQTAEKISTFWILASLSLCLLLLHIKVNKTWYIFVKTQFTLQCMFVHCLHLSHWKTLHVGEGIPLTWLSHSHKTGKASKHRKRGIWQCCCNQLSLPWGIWNLVHVWRSIKYCCFKCLLLASNNTFPLT